MDPKAIRRLTSAVLALAMLALAPMHAYAAGDEEEEERDSRRTLKARQVADEGKAQSEEFRRLAEEKRMESIERLKQLLAGGRAEGDQKAEMMLRLADLYFAQGRSIYFREMERYDKEYERCFETEGCPIDKLAPDNRQSREWQERSIKLYENILTSYPRYARADQATFFLGSALTDVGRQKDGVGAFKDLAKRYPDSAYVPDAYVLIGEYYFEQNEAFPALKAYLKASKYEDHEKHEFAVYKLSWCYFNVGEYDKAIDGMKSVVSKSMEAGQQSVNIQLQEEALKDLVRFFADAGQMNEAYDYFKGLGKDDLIRKTLKRLASQYFENGQFESSIETYRRLILEDTNNKENPSYQVDIIDAYSKLGDKQKTLAEVDRLLKDYGANSGWQRANAANPTAIADANAAIEKNLRKLAVDYHNEARKLETSRHPSAKEVYELARQAYNTYLQNFPTNENAYDVRYAYGELLYKLKDFSGAFEQYMAVVKMDPKGKHSKFCAESAIFAAEEQVKLEGGGKEGNVKVGEKHDPIPLTEWEQRLIDSCKQYAQLFPEDKKVIGVIFKSAYMLYNKYQFTAAAEQFNAVINMNPGSKQAEQAANLILDTFVLEKNWSELKKNAKFYYDMKGLGSSSFKSDVYGIYENASFKLIEVTYEADKDNNKAADGFMAFYTEFPDAKNGALALNNASIYYYNANRVADAMKVRHILVDDPKFGPKTKYYYDQIAALGFDYQQIADYERAAFYYEKLFALWPEEIKKREKDEKLKEKIPDATTKAGDAIYSAAVFRTALGDWTKGIENYNAWMAAFPEDEQIPSVKLTIARTYEDQGQFQSAADVYYNFYTKPPATATKDLVYFSRLHYGQMQLKLGQPKKANAIYADTVKLWEKEGKPPEATEFVAEMLYAAAQPKLENYLKLTLNGQGKKLIQSLKAKTQALQDVEQTFTKIVATGAGEWGVASLVDLGKVYENMAQAFRTGEVPNELTADQREIYGMQIEDKAYVQDEKAVAAYRLALETAFKFTLYNDDTAYATRQLGVLRPQEYPVMQEVLLKPGLTSQAAGRSYDYFNEM